VKFSWFLILRQFDYCPDGVSCPSVHLISFEHTFLEQAWTELSLLSHKARLPSGESTLPESRILQLLLMSLGGFNCFGYALRLYHLPVAGG